jgi:hypothetical protein
MVTVDGTVNYLYEFGGLSAVKGNYENSDEPKYLTPHLIRHLTPKKDIKVILIIRNPTERLFATYCLHKEYDNISPKRFHSIVQHQIEHFNVCLLSYSVRACVYNKHVTKSTDKIELFSGIYYVFIQDWKNVFPKMKIIRWEDYKETKAEVFIDLLDYIGLDKHVMKINITNNVIDEDAQAEINMFPKTEKMLNTFYDPYNQKLSTLLGDKKFAFQTS